MDIGNILEHSKKFCDSHGLGVWANALPDEAALDAKAVRRAETLGLTQAMAFPDLGTQLASIDTVIEESARKPVEGIPIEPKLQKSYVSDNWSKEPSWRVYQTAEGLDARKAGPYILFYNLSQVPQATLGKRGNQIARLFAQESWTGFTSPELLIANREWREARAAEGVRDEELGLGSVKWVWVVDSGDRNMCAAAFYSLQGIGMYGCKTGSASKTRGANVTVVAPLS